MSGDLASQNNPQLPTDPAPQPIISPAGQGSGPVTLPGVTAYVQVQPRPPAPIFSPEILDTLERNAPGSNRDLVNVLVEDSRSQRELDHYALHADVLTTRLGMALGTAILLALAIIGLVLVLKGHDWAGGTVLTVDFAAVIIAIVTGRSPAISPASLSSPDQQHQSSDQPQSGKDTTTP